MIKKLIFGTTILTTKYSKTMKSSKLFLIIILIALVSIVFYVVRISQQSQAYRESISMYWAKHNHFLKHSHSSPIKDKDNFDEVAYFEPNTDYKVTAEMSIIKSGENISLETSDHRQRVYMKYAVLSFELLGKHQQLTLFQNTEDKSDYFLPFFDYSNGVTTYGAGRYLPVNVKSLSMLELDFNKTMNPYCAYNKEYSCPVPPQENFLKMQVMAGEKYDIKK